MYRDNPHEYEIWNKPTPDSRYEFREAVATVLCPYEVVVRYEYRIDYNFIFSIDLCAKHSELIDEFETDLKNRGIDIKCNTSMNLKVYKI